MSKKLFIINVVICIFIYQLLNAQSLVINEFSSSNYDLIYDFQGETPDWIEIFNNTEDTIDLSSYYLSDNFNQINKWNFPQIMIVPDSFLLVFASGKDTVLNNGEVHSNFSINSEGENLYLSEDGHVLQDISAIVLGKNQSFGYFPDASQNALVLNHATPGFSNELVEIEEITFSQRGGIYDTCFTIELSKKFPENDIYYTINGSIPGLNDKLYTEPILLSESIISPEDYDSINMTPNEEFFIPFVKSKNSILIRAAVLDSLGNIIGEVKTNSYFIRDLGIDHENFPIISISIEYEDLFDYYKGIFVSGVTFDPEHPEWTGNYYKRGEEWEREINLEFYESNNEIGFNQIAGLRTHGGAVRLFLQKGLKVYADLSYGMDRFYYKMYDNNEVSSFKRFVFKPFYSSWSQSGMDDYLANRIAENLNVCGASSRPAVLYINGVYRGIYFVNEKIDEYYLESNFGVDKDSVVIVENWEGLTNDTIYSEFSELYDFIKNNDLSIASNYYYVANMIDIHNFIDYQIFEIFIANYDWPLQNMKCWKTLSKGSKWKWIFYDGDAGFREVKCNMFDHAMDESDSDWPTNEFSTLFFRKLMENNSFRIDFNARLQELLLTNFKKENLLQYYSECSNYHNNEVQRQIDKFGNPYAYEEWIRIMENLQEFLTFRICELKKHYRKSLGGELNVPDCEFEDPVLYKFEVYPNPSNGEFMCNLSLKYGAPVQVSLINYLGQTQILYDDFLLQGDNTISFNKKGLATGLYILSIYTYDNYYSTKLMIQ